MWAGSRVIELWWWPEREQLQSEGRDGVGKDAGSGWGFRWVGVARVLCVGGPDSRKPPLSLHLVYGYLDTRTRPRTFKAPHWMAKEHPDAMVRRFAGARGHNVGDTLTPLFSLSGGVTWSRAGRCARAGHVCTWPHIGM